MAIKIFIKTNDDSSFLFKNEANPGFVAKPKTYELELVPTNIKKHKADETKEYTVRCINLYTKNVLFEAVKVNEIDVNGTVYTDYATLSAALAGLVFKKGGGAGSGAQQIQSDWNQTNQSALDFIKNKPDLSLKADLVGGKVPSSQLPSYVDDVLEYDNLSLFPATGESGKIYIAKDTGFTYRWSGSVYALIHSPELDTLESVVNRGNYSPKKITFTGSTANPTDDGSFGMNPSTYSMFFGNLNPLHTGVYNLGFGYGSLQLITNGTENSVFGHYAFNKLTGLATESRWNVGIGNNVAQNLPKSSGNVFIGTFTAKNLSSSVTEADLSAISPAAVAYMKLVPDQSGYDATAQTFNTSLNTFVGNGINETSSTPTRAAMSTIIGASGLYNVKFRNFNNIVIGAGNYMNVANGIMYNSIVIGNSVNLPNQVDVLAIGMSRAGRINAADAIIYGLLPNTQLIFNAPITVPSAYMRNAQGDPTYTKQLVAKPNGDIGWEDKIPTSTSSGSITSFMNGITGVINWTKKGTKVIMELNLTFNASGYSGVLENLSSVLRPLTMGSYVINMINGNNGNIANLVLQWGNGISLYNTSLNGSFSGVIEYESYN